MQVTRTSLVTGKIHTREVPCTEQQLFAWQQGEHIQNAMPDVNPADREFIITGITPEEWDDIFGSEEAE